MGAGRFLCVALPLILTIVSLATLLYVTLAGVAHNSVSIFSINVTDLSISPASAGSVASDVLGLRARQADGSPQTENITAANLGLSDVYDVTLWGFCSTDQQGRRECTKARFDWAGDTFNTSYLEQVGAAAGEPIQLPSEVQDSLRAFRTLVKATEIVFVVALVGLGLELVLGVLSNFSRALSCLAWVESCLTTALVLGAAGLSTAMGLVVTGAVEGTAKVYGVRGDVGTKFLALAWVSAAFSLAASLFWIFTICCCKPKHRGGGDRRRSGGGYGGDREKLIPGRSSTYAPLSSEHQMGGAADGYYNPQQPEAGGKHFSPSPRYPSGSGRNDFAYEPYSHRA